MKVSPQGISDQTLQADSQLCISLSHIYICIHECIYTCVCVRVMQHIVNFLVEFIWFVFKVSFLLDLLPYQGERLAYGLQIVERRTERFITFPKLLTLSEMHTASSRIWTRVTVSIFNDNNDEHQCIYIYIGGLLNRFPHFFRMDIFIDSTHIKL